MTIILRVAQIKSVVHNIFRVQRDNFDFFFANESGIRIDNVNF